MISIVSYVPVFLLLASGYLVSKFLFRLERFTFLERVAARFGLGLLFAIISTFILGLLGLLSLFLPISVFVLCLLSVILFIKRRLSFKLTLTRKQIVTISIVFLLIFCFLVVAFRPVDFVRNPDEYKVSYWAKTLIDNKIFQPGSLGIPGLDYTPSDFWAWMRMYGFGLSLVYFFQSGSYSLFTAQIMIAMFYVMLILSTYLLGSLRSTKTGLIAALFIAFNPIVFLFSSHIMSDLPTAALATLSLYFFIKSFKKAETDNLSFLIALIFAGITLFFKGTGLFLLPFVSVYAINRNVMHNYKEILLRLVPLALFFSSFIGDAFSVLIRHVPGNSWHVFIDPLKVFSWKIPDWLNYLFTSASGAYGTFLFPEFYTIGIALLIILGFIVLMTKNREKIDFVLFFTMFYILVVFSTSDVIGGMVRHVLVVFPILLYFASIGVQQRKLRLLLIPVFIFLLIVPSQGYVPYVQNSILPTDFQFIILISGVAVLLLILCEPIFNWIISKKNLSKKFKNRFSSLLLISLLIITIGTSIYSATFLVDNAPLEVNDVTTIDGTGIPEAVSWINANIAQDSTVASNNPYQFPFYLSLTSQHYNFVSLPTVLINSSVDPQVRFLQMITEKTIDYLIVFTPSSQMGYFHFYPYMENYVDNPPAGMVLVMKTGNFAIYKTYSGLNDTCWVANFSEPITYGWSQDPRPIYQMAGNYSVNETGTKLNFYATSTVGQNTDQWSHWLAVSEGNLSIDTTKCPYLYISYCTASSNVSLQLGLVIDGHVFQSVYLPSETPSSLIINVRDSMASGNVTEVFFRARISDANTTMNAYVDKILFGSSIT